MESRYQSIDTVCMFLDNFWQGAARVESTYQSIDTVCMFLDNFGQGWGGWSLDTTA